jgi:hypothetical protein
MREGWVDGGREQVRGYIVILQSFRYFYASRLIVVIEDSNNGKASAEDGEIFCEQRPFHKLTPSSRTKVTK